MNPVAEGFQRVLAALDRLEIPHAVGGSMASSLRGNYRQTNDIDIFIEMPLGHVGEFAAQLGPDFYADASQMEEAFGRGRPCNVIHQNSAFKFDLFPLAKLRWYRMTGGMREQQWRDVTGIVAVQGDRLDRAYLDRWATELGVADLLARLLSP